MNTPQQSGWLARLLVTLTTVALVIVGFFFFTAMLVVGAVIALVFGVRLWWTLRKLKRAGVNPFGYAAGQSAPPDGTVRGDDARDGALDGEYQVVERESGAAKLPPAPTSTNTSSTGNTNSTPPAP